MGLRGFFRIRRTTAADTAVAAAAGGDSTETEPLTADQLADLQAAWSELTEAAKASGVKNIHACTRNGEPWQGDAAAVRGIASTLRNLRDEGTAPNP